MGDYQIRSVVLLKCILLFSNFLIAGAGCSTEIRTSISLWGRLMFKANCTEWPEKRTIYEEIARDHADDAGHNRTWQQCKTKIKNLTQR